MAFFIPAYLRSSSMQKRLLVFILSKFGVLDTDALDVDNLDIAWGKKTTVEFQDVGLQLKKLQELLALPPSFEVNKAKVLLLRIHLPYDAWKSPIVVEVDGVECQLRVVSKSEKGATSASSRTNHDRKSRPNRPGTSPRPVDSDGWNNEEEEDSGPLLPTAVDLAESFLQTETQQEKAQLEASLLAGTEDIGASSVLSDDGEEPTGTGAPLNLSNFFAWAFQGVLERLQVKINGILLSLDIAIPSEKIRPEIVGSTDIVTVQLKVDNIDIEGVTRQQDIEPDSDQSSIRPPQKDGKRLIYLSKIHGALISEANFFSSLARSSALSSPSTAQSDVFADRAPSSKASSSLRESMIRPTSSNSSPSPGSPSSSRHSLTSTPKRNDLPSLSNSVIASDSGRFDDASDDGEISSMSDSVHAAMSDVGDSVYGNSAYLEQLTDSEYMEENELAMGSFANPSLQALNNEDASPLSTPRASAHLPLNPGAEFDNARPIEKPIPHSMLQSTILPVRPLTRFSEGRVSQSQPTLSIVPAPIYTNEERVRALVIDDSSHDSDGEAGVSTPVGERNLAQSQLFSHEDAESMYMSALSHRSSPRDPGIWGASSLGSDGPRSAPGSPDFSSPEEPLDNLEHARISIPAQAPANLTPDSSSPASTTSSPRQIFSSLVPQTEEAAAIPQNAREATERSATSDECSRLTKQFFSLDQVAIYLPAQKLEAFPDTMSSSIYDGQSDTSRSTSLNVPGAFSTHLPEQKNSQSNPRVPIVKESPKIQDDDTIEISLGRMIIQFDVSVGRIFFQLVQLLQDVFTQNKPKSKLRNPVQSDSDANAPDMTISFGAEELSIKFLERLEGTLYPTMIDSDSGTTAGDVLLQTKLVGLRVNTRIEKALTKTSLTLKKFVFGYAYENIISFDAGLQMRASVRDLSAADGIDVSIELTQTQDTTRCEIFTLPLHVAIDLQKLDETFIWFGGLSGVLNLGSSIASNATITANSPTKPKPRGVRFEAPIRPDDRSVAAQNKADIRIGGFVLDLIGTECSIGVETSTVKLVNRDEGIGVFIQKIRLSGPHLKRSNEDPAINVEISSTRIEYLTSPKDADLDRLLSLITPSRAKYDQDDDIMLDTLLRQRKQGAVVRVSFEDFQTRVGRMHELSYLPDLGEEIARLSTVAKYLPDDDRPGLLALVAIRKFDAYVDFDNAIGSISVSSSDIEVAQVTLPSLAALSIGTLSARRNVSEELVGAATDPELREPRERSPAIMARMIGDEMEPIIRIKLWNLKAEYRVPTLMVLLGLAESGTSEDLSASLMGSIATLKDFARPAVRTAPMQQATNTQVPVDPSLKKAMTIDVVLKDCILGLNPLGLPSKMLVVLTQAHVAAVLPKDGIANASVEANKVSLLIIDNVANILSQRAAIKPRRQSFDGGSNQVADICATGYVSISYISSAKAIARMTTSAEGEAAIDVELRDDLFVLESCADSTQTLIGIFSNLAPPTPPSTVIKYRTKVIPVQDLLASLSGDAFGTAEGDYNFTDDFEVDPELDANSPEDDDADDLGFDSNFFQEGVSGHNETLFEYDDGATDPNQVTSRDTHDGVLLESFVSNQIPVSDEELDFHENHFGTGSILEGTAHRWNSARNTYDMSNASNVRKSPLKVCVRDVHIIWNLFDGYDWQQTRDTITKAVQEVESKAIEKRARSERRPTFDQDIEDDETVIGDFLFNSIYIGIPAHRDPRDLAAAINQELNDNATETESIATTTYSSSPSRPSSSRRVKSKKLRLNRSKHHKITFELRGLAVDLVTFPPGSGETQSSIDIRVHDLEVFDHVPTSTWRKFATYMQDAGERETGSSMIHIEILNVRPVPTLPAAEIVLKVTVLPLRLHVDQDALDFITRFFEFKDDSAPVKEAAGDAPFLQRVEVNDIKVKLDFKPKRVDYAGLRSGHTTEFMNFLILDEADMTMRHTIIYGISGFEKLGKCLNDIWMPDIKRNQLPGILAGLAPVRSLVNVGGGFQQLVAVPMREYKKDGRIVRSLSLGAKAFARTTGTEIVKLGAKAFIGVQTVLQGAEGILSSPSDYDPPLHDSEDSEEENKQISLYANQPVGVMQGLRGGYAGLQRDLVIARDAIIAVPGEVMENPNAAGVMRAVRKHAPTVILRPAIGVAKAGGQFLMGATNSLDPVNLKRADAKYKKH